MGNEYNFVERPFLDQLAQLGWQVLDQGEGIPQNPAGSLRSSFRELILSGVFQQAIRQLNPWLTDQQIGQLQDELLTQPGSLLEANEAIYQKLTVNRPAVDENTQTGEKFPRVTLIDWQNPERNQFHAINQFRLDTPNSPKKFIIPDIVLFINGLPLVVVEAKYPSVASDSDPLEEALEQLKRYSNQRESARLANIREGEERFFHFNQLLVRTSGDKAELGTITSSGRYFFPWRDIYPAQYEKFNPPLGVTRGQELLIQGALNKSNLLDLVRVCTLFMDRNGRRVKITARYQQFRAMRKIIDRLREKKEASERSGVVWHTQGSGKSLTMVFTIRKLRLCADLKDFKVLLVNDRVELEEQLTETAHLAGEPVTVISSTAQLKTDLTGPTSNLNMVMVHKFQERQAQLPEFLEGALQTRPKAEVAPAGEVTRFALLEEINPSERILIFIDEAHRTQSGDLHTNLQAAFPKATHIGFTGTPLLTERHGMKKTHLRFGGYIDKYRLKEAVEDGVIVRILYEGRASHHVFDQPGEFEQKFFDLCKELTDQEVIELKKRYGTTGDILEADSFVAAVAQDLVEHYVTHILPNGFKAQVVATSKIAVWKFQKQIQVALLAYAEAERTKSNPNLELIQKLGFIQVIGVVSSDGTNEDARLTEMRNHTQKLNGVENFKRPYAWSDPQTSVGFLVVCDMLRVGFDAPLEQVMYLVQKIREHDLLQTITRVNRVYSGKQCGFVVDYVGVMDHLKKALQIYAGAEEADFQDIQKTLESIKNEVPVLEARYRRLIQFFEGVGVSQIEPFVQQKITHTAQEYLVLEAAVVVLEDIKNRATFRVLLRQMAEVLDIILPQAPGRPYVVPLKRFGLILVQALQRYQDGTLHIREAGEKVRKLIDEYLVTEGIEQKIEPIELMSQKFAGELGQLPNSRARASMMTHALRKHLQVNMAADPANYGRLSEKLEAAIKQLEEDWEALLEELERLKNEVETIEKEVKLPEVFYGRIAQLVFGDDVPEAEQEAVRALVHNLLSLYQKRIRLINFWANDYEVNRLKGEVGDVLLFSNISPIQNLYEHLTHELTALAKARHEDIQKWS